MRSESGSFDPICHPRTHPLWWALSGVSSILVIPATSTLPLGRNSTDRACGGIASAGTMTQEFYRPWNPWCSRPRGRYSAPCDLASMRRSRCIPSPNQYLAMCHWVRSLWAAQSAEATSASGVGSSYQRRISRTGLVGPPFSAIPRTVAHLLLTQPVRPISSGIARSVRISRTIRSSLGRRDAGLRSLPKLPRIDARQTFFDQKSIDPEPLTVAKTLPSGEKRRRTVCCRPRECSCRWF